MLSPCTKQYVEPSELGRRKRAAKWLYIVYAFMFHSPSHIVDLTCPCAQDQPPLLLNDSSVHLQDTSLVSIATWFLAGISFSKLKVFSQKLRLSLPVCIICWF